MKHFVDNEPLEITEVRQIRRITVRNLIATIADAFNLERGGIYTVKALFKNPGKVAVEYLGQYRYKYTPPFRILIITTAIMILLMRYSDSVSSFGTGLIQGSDESSETMQAMIDSFSNYFNLIIWSLIPVMALMSYLLNRKIGYNFAEHLVFQTYLFCLTNILTFLLPLDTIVGYKAITIYIFLVPFIYYIYGYKVFTGRSLLRSLWDCGLIYFIATSLWAILGILLMVAYFKMNGL